MPWLPALPVVFPTAVEVTTIGVGHLLSGMADEYLDTSAPFRRRLVVALLPRSGAADAEALVQQHFGDAAHADTADAYEMNAFDFVFHVLPVPGRPRQHHRLHVVWPVCVLPAPCCCNLSRFNPRSSVASCSGSSSVAAAAARHGCRPIPGIAGLVIVHRMRIRHQNAGYAGCRQLGYRQCASAADHQIGIAIACAMLSMNATQSASTPAWRN